MSAKTRNREKFSFAVRDCNDESAKDPALQIGDLVLVVSKTNRGRDRIGILLGESDQKDGLVLHIKSSKSKIYGLWVRDIEYVTFLARGLAANYLLSFIENQASVIKEVQNKLSELTDKMPLCT